MIAKTTCAGFESPFWVHGYEPLGDRALELGGIHIENVAPLLYKELLKMPHSASRLRPGTFRKLFGARYFDALIFCCKYFGEDVLVGCT